MKSVSNKFKRAIKEYGRQIDIIIAYTDDNGEHLLDSNSIFSVTPVTNGNILKSVMKELEFESSIKVPKDTVINVRFGVQIDLSLTVEEVNQMMVDRLNSTPVMYSTKGLKGFEYINFGNYIISKEPEYNVDTQSYLHICYDKMLYSMKNYEKINISYPITVREYINKICEYIGLIFKDKNNTFANYNKQMKDDLYDGYNYTYRDVFDELAQVTASTICINEITDELEIRYLNDTQDIIDEDYLKDTNVEFSEKYGPINSVVLSRSAESDNVYLQDKESIAKNGLCELKIVDNQIMNDNDRSVFLHDILDKLNGINYYINSFNSPGITWYELCDKYTVKIGNNQYNCVLLNDEIKITQGLEETIYTELPKVSKTDYSKADKTDSKINKAYIIMDKVNKKLESVITEISDSSEKLTKHEQDINSIIDTVKSVETNLDENYSTTEQVESKIEQKAGTITQEVNKTIENIQVGGTNLIRNSAPYNRDYWIAYNVTSATVEEDSQAKRNCMKTILKSGQSGLYNNSATYANLEKNKEYSFSIWLKVSRNQQIRVGYEGSTHGFFDVTTEWKKYTLKFTCIDSVRNFIVYATNATAGDILYFHSLKLEERK